MSELLFVGIHKPTRRKLEVFVDADGNVNFTCPLCSETGRLEIFNDRDIPATAECGGCRRWFQGLEAYLEDNNV